MSQHLAVMSHDHPPTDGPAPLHGTFTFDLNGRKEDVANRKLRDSVWRRAKRAIRNPDDAEDVAGQTLAACYQHLETTGYTSTQPAKDWPSNTCFFKATGPNGSSWEVNEGFVTVIFARKYVDWLRKQQRTPSQTSPDRADSVRNPPSPPELDCSAAEKLLVALPPQEIALLGDLRLDTRTIVFPGRHTFRIHPEDRRRLGNRELVWPSGDLRLQDPIQWSDNANETVVREENIVERLKREAKKLTYPISLANAIHELLAEAEAL